MPIRIVAGQQEGGYTDAFEIVCCDCGDDPDLDYREVSPELQRIRGPYHPIKAGAAAYTRHVAGHDGAERGAVLSWRPGRRRAPPLSPGEG
jgi:hypothetical protein